MCEIPVCFSMTGRCTKSQKHDNEYDMDDVAKMFRLGEYTENQNILEYLRYRTSEISIVDRKKNKYCLVDIWYKPWNLDKTSFVAGKIIDINQYQKGYVHVMCEYQDQGGTYKGCFILPAESYEEAERKSGEGEDEFLIGTCIRKKYVCNGPYHYNKYAHSGSVSEKNEKAKTKMLHFCLIRMSRAMIG